MQTPLESIQLALATDATEEARAAGAAACRTMLTALEAKTGEQMPNAAPTSDAAGPVPNTAPAIGPQQIAQILSALRGLPPEQLLDLAIARLRSALPVGATMPAVTPIRFQIIPVAPLAQTVGSKGGGS